jgi:hypothetical protein
MGNQPSAATGILAATAFQSVTPAYNPTHYMKTPAWEQLPSEKAFIETVSATVPQPSYGTLTLENNRNIPDIDKLPHLPPEHEKDVLPWTYMPRNPVPEDVLYLAQIVRNPPLQGTLNFSKQEDRQEYFRRIVDPANNPKQVGVKAHGLGDDFGAQYLSLITTQNIDKFVPYGGERSGKGTAVLFLYAKDALSEYDYHLNIVDIYGNVSPERTYYPWELNQFVKDAQVVPDTYNEVVFHDWLDSSKVLKNIIFYKNGVFYDIYGELPARNLWRDVMPRTPIELSEAEKLNIPFTRTERPMLPILCHDLRSTRAPDETTFLLDPTGRDRWDKMTTVACRTKPSTLQALHEEATRVWSQESGRNNQDFAQFIRAWHMAKRDYERFQPEYKRGVRVSPPAIIEGGGYKRAYFGVRARH